ncbi:MAG: PD40 domain-containing protein, partial [Gemmatimonadetes bacterium]|nr:PD40 domain-containing protein [Gemmatimonadota bacterium]
RITFTAGGRQSEVFVMDVDGSNARRVSNQRENRMFLPAWTPDGHYIIARVGGDSNIRGRGELWMYHVDGGTGMRLTGEEVNASWPATSPDGRYLYYEERVAQGFADPNPAKAVYQLRRLNRRTGKILEITSGIGPARDGGGGRRSSGGAVAPELSPDGRWLAFGRRLADGTYNIAGHEYGPRTALWLRDLYTGGERIIMDPITPDIQERNNAGALPRYSWTPDGESIVIPEGGKLRRLHVETGRIETIPFTARVEETISERVYSPIRVTDEPLDVRMMRWHTGSPDGRTLAFQALSKIWLMDLPNGKPRRLTDQSFAAQEYAPAWSPDGNWLAFTSWSDADGGHLWKVRKSGGTPQRLTPIAAVYLNPVWSPDGEQLVVARGSGAMLRGRMPSDEPWFELEAVPAEGGPVQSIVTVSVARRGHVIAPRFGPDGRVFYLEQHQTEQGTTPALTSVRLDGMDARTHVLLPSVDEAAPSPDGQWLAFQRGNNVYLAPLPWPGTAGDPVEIGVDEPELPVERLSLEGGNFPQWIDATTLAWGSANQYFRHRVDGQSIDTFRIALQVPRRRATGTIALTGSRIVTMDGDNVIPQGDVVVRDGRIAAVGPSGTVTIPAGARRIDASGATVIPGLVDTHMHMSREARGILSERSWELAANLAYGLTTGLEPSGWEESIFTMAEDVEAGIQIGPRVYSTGSSLSGGTSTTHGAVESPEDARHEVNRIASYGARTIKQYWQPRREQRQWVVEASRQAGLMVTSEGDTDHLSAIGLIMDGHTGFEHPILTIPLYRDVAQFLGQAGAFYSATLVVGGAGPWGEEYFYQESDLWKDEKLRRFTPWRWLEPHTRRRALRPKTDYTFPLHAQGAEGVPRLIGEPAMFESISLSPDGQHLLTTAIERPFSF